MRPGSRTTARWGSCNRFHSPSTHLEDSDGWTRKLLIQCQYLGRSETSIDYSSQVRGFRSAGFWDLRIKTRGSERTVKRVESRDDPKADLERPETPWDPIWLADPSWSRSCQLSEVLQVETSLSFIQYQREPSQVLLKPGYAAGSEVGGKPEVVEDSETRLTTSGPLSRHPTGKRRSLESCIRACTSCFLRFRKVSSRLI